MKIALGIETSCDDTSVALVRDDGFVIAIATQSQDQLHKPFGGIVPEIASRNHTHNLLSLIEQVKQKANFEWHDLEGIAVTNRPGLLGSLLVGVVTTKTLAFVLKKPFIGVHHLEGHIFAPFLGDENLVPTAVWKEPFLALVVSGGHTAIYLVEKFGSYKLLGQTIDDAAGEAFDKFAKLLNLGYPGGAEIDRLSKQGDPKKFAFPRGMIKEDNLDFSFSGLKTSAQVLLKKLTPEEIKNQLPDLCASYQEAIVEVLSFKLQKASQKYRIKKLVITGGVSANSRLRNSIPALVPAVRYCTDNAAMIGYVGLKRLLKKEYSNLEEGVFARSELDASHA